MEVEVLCYFCPNFVKPPDPKKGILEYSIEWLKANVSISSKRNRVQFLLAWVPPPSGTFKLNVDSARLGSNGVIGSGGLNRDWHGNWITGFIAKKGVGEVLHAQPLFYGLKVAKARNFSHLIVKADLLWWSRSFMVPLALLIILSMVLS